MRVIETATLELEPQVAAHADEMFGVLSDPVIYAHRTRPRRRSSGCAHRYRRLETRRSADGREAWLNWVIRLPESGLIGYVQATVDADGRAAIAYELASRYRGRGPARAAVEAMIGELVAQHGVRALSAVLKRTNVRSLRLLERLGFALAPPELHVLHEIAPDEVLMLRDARCA